jgi:hypothetical protein
MRSADFGTSRGSNPFAWQPSGGYGRGGQAADWMDPMKWYAALYGPLLESLGSMPGAGARGGRDARGWGRHRHEDECGCGHEPCWGCDEDACHCRCCVTGADLVVYARLGERRVIPVVVENTRRRDREVTVEIGEWTTRGGRPAGITSHIVGDTTFPLKPCEERQVVVLVDIRSGQGDHEPRGGLTDVDDCTVYYADLRLEGCTGRATRIAIAVLPRDCYPHPVPCGCSCC